MRHQIPEPPFPMSVPLAAHRHPQYVGAPGTIVQTAQGAAARIAWEPQAAECLPYPVGTDLGALFDAHHKGHTQRRQQGTQGDIGEAPLCHHTHPTPANLADDTRNGPPDHCQLVPLQPPFEHGSVIGCQ
jgi:hypothetical protein